MSRSTPARVWAISAVLFFVPTTPVSDRARDCDPAELSPLPFRLPLLPDTIAGDSPPAPRSEPLAAEAMELPRSFRGSDKRRAMESLERILDVAVERRDAALEQLSAVRLGDLRQSLGLLAEAIELYQRAIRIDADERVRIEARMGLSRALLRRDDFAAGKQEALSALAASRALSDRSLEAKALVTLGIAFYFSRELPMAVSVLERAIAILEPVGENRNLGEAVFYYGFAKSDLGQEWTGLKAFERAHRISRARGERDIETEALLGFAHAHSRLGEKQRALEYYYQAAPLVEEGGDPTLSATLYTGMGYIHNELGDFDEAERLYLKALALHEKLGSITIQAGIRMYLGRIYGARGERQRALALFLEARDLLERVSDRQLESVLLGEIATAQAGMGQEAEALETFDRALSMARRNGFERDEAELLVGLGEIERRRGANDRARATLQKALELSRKTESPFAEARALFNLARLDRDEGRFDEALGTTEAALQKVETLRSQISSQRLRVSYVASAYELHAFHVELLMELERRRPGAGYLERAFLAADRARARTLLDTVANGRDGLTSFDPALLDYEARLVETLGAAAAAPTDRCDVDRSRRSAELSDLIAELDRVRAVLQSRRAPEVASTEIASVADVQMELVDDRTALLAYFLGDEASYVWAVTRSGISAHRLPSRDRIESHARQLYALLAARERRKGETGKERHERLLASDSEYWRTALSLSETLLGKAVRELDVDRLLVVGDGVLNRIPFSALPSPEDEGAAEPKPLVTRYEIVRLPSVAIGKALAGRRPSYEPKKKVAVLADPVLDRDDPRLVSAGDRTAFPEAASSSTFRDLPPSISDLPRLLSSREEAKRISELVPAGEGFEALGFDANVGLVASGALAGFEVVHIASHGIVSSEHPELSGIVLSLFDREGNAVQGYLRLHDLYDLDLPVRLVVLSACSTALGKEMRGEGLIGLVSGFLSSGSRGVIASYWDVEDEATAELMSRFYRHLFVDNVSPSRALQIAQSSMWMEERWRSPELWGAFELQGLGE